MFLLFLHWIVSGLALALTAALVPGFRIRSFGTALVAVLLIGAANVLVRPILVFLTLPFTILTFGLFLFVVDAIILRLCAALMRGFEISGWIAAVMGAVILALASSILHFAFV